MKERMGKMTFKPKDIMSAVKDEPNEHKYRICVYAALMLGVSTTYQMYFDSVSFRAGIMQREALAGQRSFLDFKNKNSRDIWSLRKTLAVLDDKSLKDIKYINSGEGDYERRLGSHYTVADLGLVSDTYLDDWDFEMYYQEDADGVRVTDASGANVEIRDWSDGIIYSGPQGDPKADKLYFTETYTKETKDMTQWEHEMAVKYETDPVGFSKDLYEEWRIMHEGTIWYDTAGCMSGGMVGQANAVEITPITTRYNQTHITQDWPYSGSSADASLAGTTSTQPVLQAVSGWWAPWNAREDEPYLPTYEQNRPAAPATFQDGFETTYSRGAISNANYRYPEGRQGWDVQVAVSGQIDVFDEDLYREGIRDMIDLIDDCDIECQQRGSGLSMVATLMSIPYAFFGLSAIMMILGNVAPGCRVGALFCSIMSGCCLFVFLLVSATMLFSQYSTVCRRSMVKTAGDGNAWYMADDFRMVITLWATSWIVGMCLCCCGCANAKNVTK